MLRTTLTVRLSKTGTVLSVFSNLTLPSQPSYKLSDSFYCAVEPSQAQLSSVTCPRATQLGFELGFPSGACLL